MALLDVCKAYGSTGPSSESCLLALSLATLSSPAKALPVTVDQPESSQELRPGHDGREAGKRDLNEGFRVPLSFGGSKLLLTKQFFAQLQKNPERR